MAGRKKGAILWSYHIQALVTKDVDNAVREYAKDRHNGSISTAARTALEAYLRQVGYLDTAA